MRQRSFCVFAVLLLMILILRETGAVKLNGYAVKPDWTYTSDTAFHQTEAIQLRFEENTGSPFVPKILKPDDTYDVVVRYRFDENLSWTRWLPFWKSGNNEEQLVYSVWLGRQLAGSGHVTLTGHQSVTGLCAAREYRDLLRAPVIAEMHRQVNQKVHLFTRPSNTNS